MPEFTKKMLKGEKPIVYGDGIQTRDFTYVKDVVNTLIEYGQGRYKNRFGVCEVGYGEEHMVTEVFHIIAKLTGYEGGVIHKKEREGDIKKSRAYELMEKPKYGFEKGLKRTVKWIKEAKPYETNL